LVDANIIPVKCPVEMPTKDNPNLFSFEAKPANTKFLTKRHENGVEYKETINAALTRYRKEAQRKRSNNKHQRKVKANG
jgi:hypothetical protein